MANTADNQFGKSYHSFSGVDIKAVFGSKVIAEIQAISYSVTREKAPLYTMGSADPRSFSRGKRGIAGTLIFLMFDEHALLGLFGMIADRKHGAGTAPKFLADKDDFIPQNTNDASVTTLPIAQVSDPNVAVDFDDPDFNIESDITNVGSDQVAMAPWFSDQIPPFDITLAAANEYGSFAVMRIFGVELLNEGYGVSIDDITSEMQNTYIARTLVPWQKVELPGLTSQLYT